MNIQNMTPKDIYFSIMAVCGFLIAMILYLRKKKRSWKKSDFLDKIINRQKTNEDILYKKLLSMVFGSRDTAERLIRMEQGRIPSLSRAKSIQAAIERIKQDMR